MAHDIPMDGNTHNLVCDFGPHKGELYTRIPLPYLKWLVNTEHRVAWIAQAELDRRGIATPDLEISSHAVDRASLHCRKIWLETSRKNEGIYSWLCRMAEEAIDAPRDFRGKHNWKGMAFMFSYDGVWPVLKTVTRNKE